VSRCWEESAKEETPVLAASEPLALRSPASEIVCHRREEEPERGDGQWRLGGGAGRAIVEVVQDEEGKGGERELRRPELRASAARGGASGAAARAVREKGEK
jgi:hypothetical protein